MKNIFLIGALFAVSLSALALDYSGEIRAEDQKYYKNEAGAGNNQLERIDSTVKEINALYGQMASMKSDIAQLKAEVEALKKKIK